MSPQWVTEMTNTLDAGIWRATAPPRPRESDIHCVTGALPFALGFLCRPNTFACTFCSQTPRSLTRGLSVLVLVWCEVASNSFSSSGSQPVRHAEVPAPVGKPRTHSRTSPGLGSRGAGLPPGLGSSILGPCCAGWPEAPWPVPLGARPGLLTRRPRVFSEAAPTSWAPVGDSEG